MAVATLGPEEPAATTMVELGSVGSAPAAPAELVVPAASATEAGCTTLAKSLSQARRVASLPIKPLVAPAVPGEPVEPGEMTYPDEAAKATDAAAKFTAVAEKYSSTNPGRLARYYAALGGDGEFPAVSCNAPWVSVVIEADGGLRPCFFHRTIDNIRARSLADIIRDDLGAFRRSLDVAGDPVCQRCVCSLNTSWRSAPWLQ